MSRKAVKKKKRVGLLERTQKFIKRNRLISEGDSLLVTCSGGVDSIVLLYLLDRLKEKLGITLTVLHFNHLLRGAEAERDAEFVRNTAARMELDFILKELQVRKEASSTGESVQEAGHRLRAAVYAKLTEPGGFDKVVTAHHLDDQLETLLMRLVTGTGLSGMAGIRVKTGNVVRPLLSASKNEIIAYAEAEGLNWIEDSSNKSEDYLRNRLRLEVVPLLKAINPSITTVAGRTASNFAGLSDGLSRMADEILLKSTVSRTGSEIILAIPFISDYFNLIGHFLLKSALKSLAVSAPGVSHAQVEEVRTLLAGGATGAEVTLSGGYRALRDRDRLVVYRSKELPDEAEILPEATAVFGMAKVTARLRDWNERSEFPDGANREVVDYDEVKDGKLILRGWREGDIIKPLGLGGRKKVSDVLTEAKVAKNMKRAYPVVSLGEKIVWVCGLKLSDDYKVTASTRRVLEMELLEGD